MAMLSPDMMNMYLVQMGFYAQIVFVLLVMGALTVFGLVLLNYKYKCVIFEKRGTGAYRIRRDRAKLINDKGVLKYKTFFGKSMFPPPGDNQMYMEGKKDFFMLFKNENNFLYPVSFNNPSVTFKIMDNDVIDWMISEFKKSSEIYKETSFWDQYGHIVVQITFVGVMFIIFLILLNKMDGVANALNSIPGKIELVIPGGGVTPPG